LGDIDVTIHHKPGGKLTAACCKKEFLPATISFLIFPTISRLKGKKKTGVGWCLNNNQSFISVFGLLEINYGNTYFISFQLFFVTKVGNVN